MLTILTTRCSLRHWPVLTQPNQQWHNVGRPRDPANLWLPFQVECEQSVGHDTPPSRACLIASALPLPAPIRCQVLTGLTGLTILSLASCCIAPGSTMGDRLTQLQDAVDQVNKESRRFLLSAPATRAYTNGSSRNSSSHPYTLYKEDTISKPWGQTTKLGMLSRSLIKKKVRHGRTCKGCLESDC